jgi:hypothetical protein
MRRGDVENLTSQLVRNERHQTGDLRNLTYTDALPAKTRHVPTLQTVLIFSCSSGLNMRGGWPARLVSEAGTPKKDVQCQ